MILCAWTDKPTAMFMAVDFCDRDATRSTSPKRPSHNEQSHSFFDTGVGRSVQQALVARVETGLAKMALG